MTPYEVLGVDPSASPTAVRRAYLALARRHHPDFHTNATPARRAAAEREMQRINDAWAVLGDPVRRRTYDEHVRLGADAAMSPGAAPGGSPEDLWDPRTGRAHPDFVPIDDDDDPDYRAVLDAMEADDTPMPGARPVARWQQLLPVGLFLAALASLSVGLVINLSQLLGLGVVLLVLAGVSFLVAPMMALLTGYERDPRR